MRFLLVLFLFKQKTAYEMRISDWSSDVCSSDLNACRSAVAGAVAASSVADGLHAAIMSAAPSAPATCAWRRALRIIAALLVASSSGNHEAPALNPPWPDRKSVV